MAKAVFLYEPVVQVTPVFYHIDREHVLKLTARSKAVYIGGVIVFESCQAPTTSLRVQSVIALVPVHGGSCDSVKTYVLDFMFCILFTLNTGQVQLLATFTIRCTPDSRVLTSYFSRV